MPHCFEAPQTSISAPFIFCWHKPCFFRNFKVGEAVILETPALFFGIGQFYSDFAQVSDEEVLQCLEQSRTVAGYQRPGRTSAEGTQTR